MLEEDCSELVTESFLHFCSYLHFLTFIACERALETLLVES